MVGRHSLLWNIEENLVTITSVGHKDCKLIEVPATGIFMIDFSQSSQVGNTIKNIYFKKYLYCMNII